MTTRRRRTGPRAGEEFRSRARRGLPPDEVRALSRLSPWRAVLSSLQTAALAAASIAAAVLSRGHRGHALVVAAALLGVAGAQHALAVLAHEAAHYRSFKTRWLNDLVGMLCAAPLGLSMLTYRAIHRIHHNHLYEPLDPDLALMAGYPRGRAYLVRKLRQGSGRHHGLQELLLLRRQAAGRAPHGRHRPVAARAPRAASAGSSSPPTSPSSALSIYFGFWRWYLLLWFLPLVTLLQAILRLRAIMEHGAVDDTTTPLKAARTNFVPLLALLAALPARRALPHRASPLPVGAALSSGRVSPPPARVRRARRCGGALRWGR